MDIKTDKEKVLFLHMNQLGDLLFSLPLLAGARKTWQDKKLYSLARPELAPLLKDTGLVDEVIVKQKRGLFNKLNLAGTLKKERFDMAVSFSESPESMLLSYFSNIPKRYGFKTASLSFFLTNKTARQGVPSIANNRNFAQTLGLSEIPKDYTGLIKVPQSELDKIDAWLLKEKVSSRFLVMAPGASKRRKDKYWLQENWVKVIQNLKNTNMTILLAGAPGELNELNALAKNVNGPVKIFVSNEGVTLLAALLKRARGFAGIDSGAMHLAASLGVPVVALFAPTDPRQVGPLPLDKHIVIKKDKMSDITPQEVISALTDVLNKKQ